jgi:very-short-patch-repair endonuclease
MNGEAQIVVLHRPPPARVLRYHSRMHVTPNEETPAPEASRLDDLARARRSAPTPAEAALECILNQLGDGVLSGTFKREHRVGNWLVDFYFPAIRLAIEVDGGYHRAQSRWRKDLRKTADLKTQGITVLRLTNAQVFGDRAVLVELLRGAWRSARLAQTSVGRAGAGDSRYRAREPLACYFVAQLFAGAALSPA